MPWGRALACITSVAAIGVLYSCTTVEHFVKPQRYIDLQFPVGKSAAQQYSHVVDGNGALWYIDGDRVVRAPAPSLRQTMRDSNARAGRLFWYSGAVYVLGGEGTRLMRIGGTLRSDDVMLPAQYSPAEGVVADANHGWLVFAQESRHQLAVLDVWKWYGERVSGAIEPFAASLAGGPRGKKYLVVADASKPLLAIKNRRNEKSVVVGVPSNDCFAQGGRSWRVPVDVRGRDEYRTWATTGSHVVSIDLDSKKVLRTWDLDGCAMRILTSGPDGVTVSIGTQQDGSYSTSVVRVDRDGVHALRQYGTVEGLAGGAWIDRYERLWWFDPKAHAFVCRTPLA